MTNPQNETIDFLKSIGYTVIRDSILPLLENKCTGVRIRVAFDGRQVFVGYTAGHKSA